MARPTALTRIDLLDAEMTLDEWAVICWPMLAIATRTRLEYIAKYRRHISPHLGKMPLNKIKRTHVQLWLRRLPASFQKAHLPVLQALFREATVLFDDLVDPTVGVVKESYAPAARDFVTWDRFKDFNFGPNHTDMFRFMAAHGTRWSETVVITTDDIRTGASGITYVWITKSAHSRVTKGQRGSDESRARRIPYRGFFPSSGTFPTAYKAAWIRFHNGTLGWDGNPEHYLTPHSARYTFAYTLASSGIKPKVAQKLLGHATLGQTMDLYTKVLPEDIDEAAALLGRLD